MKPWAPARFRRIALAATLLSAVAPATALGGDQLLVQRPTAPQGMRLVNLNDQDVGVAIPELRFANWSPNGERIIGKVADDVVAMDPDGSDRITAASGWNGPVFSPDGQKWAGWRYGSSGAEIGVGSVAGGTVQVVPNLPQALFMDGARSQVAWSSANEIAFAFYSDPQVGGFSTREIGLIKPDGTGFRSVLTLPQPPKPRQDDNTYDAPLDLAFTPDGKTRAVGRYISLGRLSGNAADPFTYDFRITTVAVQPGGLATDRSVGSAQSFGSLVITGLYPIGLSFAPDGQRLAVVGPGGDTTKVVVYRPDSGSVTPIGARTLLKVRWRPTVADTDGDALLDTWETVGLDADGDGTVDVDLGAMGADPEHKDIFVELDYMPPHEILQPAVGKVITAFANAPVLNPDATMGITLHVDNGPGSVMNPRTGALWGTRSEHGSVPHANVLGSVVGSAYDWGDFDTIKTANFPEAREAAFRYAISAHAHQGTFSGIARGIPSSDFLVTLGAGCLAQQGVDCTLGEVEQAGTFMHELGHTIGLHHGGDDDVLHKPSYLSVMNYAYQLTGLWRANLTTELDYSRIGVAMNENALDETNGFGFAAGSPQAAFMTLGRCPSGASVLWPLLSGPVDFNCDGSTSPGTIASDTNADGLKTAFNAYSDWPNIVLKGGAVGDLGAPILAAQTPLMEPPLEELLASKKVFDDYVAAHGPSPPGGEPSEPGGGAPDPPAESSSLGPLPTLRGLAVKPSAFPAATRGATVARGRGARVSYRLSIAARVRFKVERLMPRGRRLAVRGGFRHSGRVGSNAFRFTGRVGGRALRPGRYRLIATPLAIDGRRGKSRVAGFRVLAG